MRRLTLERTLKGWTQQELGRRSGVNITTVSMIERGRYIPGRSTLERLADGLGVPLADALRLLDPVEYSPLSSPEAARR